MKMIISILTVMIMLFAFSVGSYAEIIVDDKWFDDMLFDYIIGSNHTHGSLGAAPEYTNTNGTTIAFYISDTGKANVTYTISRSADSSASTTAEIYLEKHIAGPFWQRLNTKWKDTFTEKYHVQSFTANVNESGLYRVVMNVTSGKDNFSTSASFDYEKGKMLGDVVSDGKITAADARKVLRYSAKLESYSANIEINGDVNRDGRITSADARLILKIATMKL